MSTEIIAAIISATAVIIAAIIGALYTRSVYTIIRSEGNDVSILVSKELVSKKLRKVIGIIFFILVAVIITTFLLLKKELNIASATNSIVTRNFQNIIGQEFNQSNLSPYCYYSDCPNLDSENLNIFINFRQTAIVSDIACLRVLIYRIENRNDIEERTSRVLDEFFKIRPVRYSSNRELDESHGIKRKTINVIGGDNYIAITNDFEKGKYEILYGFIFKEDIIKKNPTFYSKSCIVIK